MSDVALFAAEFDRLDRVAVYGNAARALLAEVTKAWSSGTSSGASAEEVSDP